MHTDEEGPGHEEPSDVGNFHVSQATIISFQHKTERRMNAHAPWASFWIKPCFVHDRVPNVYYILLKNKTKTSTSGSSSDCDDLTTNVQSKNADVDVNFM